MFYFGFRQSQSEQLNHPTKRFVTLARHFLVVLRGTDRVAGILTWRGVESSLQMASPTFKWTIPILAAAIASLTPSPALTQPAWWVTASTGVGVYARIGTNNFLVDMLPAGLERNAYSTSIALGRTLAVDPRGFAWEAEGQTVQYAGRQRHWELDTAVLFRWTKFPWNDNVQTTLAVGEGISLASKTSVIEAQRNARTSKLLNFFVIEGTLALPGRSQAHLVLRLNHRSGIYGFFDGVRAGSNFVSLGVRLPLYKPNQAP